MPAMKQQHTMEAVTVKNVGERCGICDFSVKHLSTAVFASVFDNHGFTAGRQREACQC